MSEFIPGSRPAGTTLLDIMKEQRLIDEIQNERIPNPQWVTDPIKPIAHKRVTQRITLFITASPAIDGFWDWFIEAKAQVPQMAEHGMAYAVQVNNAIENLFEAVGQCEIAWSLMEKYAREAQELAESQRLALSMVLDLVNKEAGDA